MAKVVRYVLATCFFAVSVGCLVLWGWSEMRDIYIVGPNYSNATDTIYGEVKNGVVALENMKTPARLFQSFEYSIYSPIPPRATSYPPPPPESVEVDRIGVNGNQVYFPLWYSALVSVLSGVVVLRFRRQFSIRSSMIVTALVAALIAMVIIL